MQERSLDNALSSTRMPRAATNGEDRKLSPAKGRSKPVVLHVVEAFGGGVFQSIANICHGLADRFDFVILHGRRPETPDDCAAFFPENTRFVQWSVRQTLSPAANLRSIRQLRDVVREIAPIRVHAHSSTAGALARLAFPARARFVIYSPRCYAFLRKDISLSMKVAYAGIEWFLGRALPHTVAACGHHEYAHARRMARTKVCIPNSVDPSAIDAATTGVEKHPQVTVVDAGRINPQKNFAMFAKIAAALHDNTEIRFVWIGDGDLESALGGRPLPDNVTVTGWVPYVDGLRAMASANVFLHTALWEGLSRTCLEAATLRLPLLLHPFDGARELVPEQGKTGYICKTTEEFITRLEMLAADVSLRTQLGTNARHLVEENYGAAKSNRLWDKMYSSGSI